MNLDRPALEVSDLRKSYGSHEALRGVSLAIEPGQVVALLGPNGAGKSTLVSIVSGLLAPTSGEVRVCGEDPQHDPLGVARRLVGAAGQETGVYPSLSVRQNLAVFGRLYGLRRDDLVRRVPEVAELLGLDALLERKAAALSGGERRRLHTAIALIHEPRLVLLDEPTVGADVETRVRVLDAVRHLAAAGSAICYTTHYLEEVERLGADVVIIDRGRVITRGSVAELQRLHASGVVEITFVDQPPESLRPAGAVATGRTWRLEAHNPATVLQAVLADMAGRGPAIASIEVIPANLESAFIALTGRRFAPDEEEETTWPTPTPEHGHEPGG